MMMASGCLKAQRDSSSTLQFIVYFLGCIWYFVHLTYDYFTLVLLTNFEANRGKRKYVLLARSGVSSGLTSKARVRCMSWLLLEPRVSELSCLRYEVHSGRQNLRSQNHIPQD